LDGDFRRDFPDSIERWKSIFHGSLLRPSVLF
jgi:hypothetical protein